VKTITVFYATDMNIFTSQMVNSPIYDAPTLIEISFLDSRNLATPKI